MKGVNDKFQPIEGEECLKDRIQRAINTPLGSIPLREDFGSSIHQMVDRNVDSAFYQDVNLSLINLFTNPANGLSECKYLGYQIITKNNVVTLTLRLKYEGRVINLEGLNYGRN